MKKQLIHLVYLLLLSELSNSQQITPKESETIGAINTFRRSTVSFGVVRHDTFQNIDGMLVSKRIFKPVGTGVCFYFNFENITVPCLITAKHIFYDSTQSWFPDTLFVRFSESDTLAIDSYFGIPLALKRDSQIFWFPHSDPSVDLACLPLDPTIEWPIKKWPILPYAIFANKEDYFEGKEIYTLGYPTAVGVDLASHAFLRKGIIAWVDKAKNITNKKILIDCTIFPGNSGGPVFSVSNNLGQILLDTVLQLPRFYGIVSQRRFSPNNVTSKNGKIIDATGADIFSIESVAVGVIVTADKVKELLEEVKFFFDNRFK